MAEFLDIVNENDEVIDVMERSEASKRGLGYRIIFVLFYTPMGDVILQRRHPLKSAGGMFTTTASGHVESGKSYEETAIKETKEETGVDLEPTQLVDLGKRSYHAQRGMRWAGVYLHEYAGSIEDLTVEENEGDGFVAVPLDELKLAVEQKQKEYTLFAITEFAEQLLSEVERRITPATRHD
ncbi:NUDIX domain-containing protein [Candidatus Saccharibacteria bacterium]|nr:NUDIX domain-containing protein [Candidatus Saccharibacteria bacterium]